MAIFYEDVLRGLLQRKVRFVIVGGTAVVLRGVPRMTADLDLVVDLKPENVLSLVEVLGALGFLPRPPVDPKLLADPKARGEWLHEKGMMAFSFWHPGRPMDAVDILFASPLDYATLVRTAESVLVEGLELPVASARDLIALKRGTGRKQDAADVNALERLLEAEGEE